MAIVMRITCAADDRHPVKYDPRTEWYKHDAMYRFCNEHRIIAGDGKIRSKPVSRVVVSR